MTPLVFVWAALILALIDEFQAQGRSLTGWAVALLCVYLIVLATRLF